MKRNEQFLHIIQCCHSFILMLIYAHQYQSFFLLALSCDRAVTSMMPSLLCTREQYESRMMSWIVLGTVMTSDAYRWLGLVSN